MKKVTMTKQERYEQHEEDEEKKLLGQETKLCHRGDGEGRRGRRGGKSRNEADKEDIEQEKKGGKEGGG